MPTFIFPGGARACRVILPLGVKVIVNFVPVGEAALKGVPSKNVALMSFGAIGSAAKATPALNYVNLRCSEYARKLQSNRSPAIQMFAPLRMQNANDPRPLKAEYDPARLRMRDWSVLISIEPPLP